MKDFISNKSFQGISNRSKMNLLQNYWLKSFKAPIPYNQIISHLVFAEYRDDDIICRSNEKITFYFFLVQGTVNGYETKDGYGGAECLCQIRQPQSIGQNIYSFNTHRSCTWKAIGSVKCFKISAEILIGLTTETVNQYNSILYRLSQILDVDTSYLSRFQLYKKMTYKQFTKNVNITQSNERSGTKSLFLILEGQCKFCVKSQYLRKSKPNQQIWAYQQHILNLCSNEIVGIEPLFESEYKYDYIVSTANCQLIELDIKDIRDYFQFPPQLKERMEQIYIQHKKISQKALSKITQVENQSIEITKTKSEMYVSNGKTKKFLQDACMYIPAVNKTVQKKEVKKMEPTSAFIPLKKRQENTTVEMRRKDWRSYIKLPILQNRVVGE